MHKIITMLLVAAAALLTVALATTAANALGSLQLRGGERGIAASGRITFFTESLRAETSWACNVTLLKTMSTVIPKVLGMLIGKVNGVAIDYGNNHCSHGSGIEAINRIIPLRNASREMLEGGCPETGSGVHLCDVSGGGVNLWRLFYESFDGTLPNILAINRTIGEAPYKVEMRSSGVNLRCLWIGKIKTRVRVERGVIRQGEVNLSEELTLFKDLLFGCPRKPRLVGALNFTPSLTIILL